ncbi:MAG TPA: glycoside hydrolase family 16 protein [Ktedonobacterales bacterium]|nr:glycoside hydrolase family 16 protein [Ktedonobacterales bacterium]
MQRFSHGDKDTSSQPQRRRSSLFTRRIYTALLALAAVVLVLGLSFTFGKTPTARAATWTQIWGDEFNGAANTGVNTSNWLYDTGTGYGCSGCPSGWGTGEVESMTNSTANVYQDGSGHLVIKAINSGGNWTSGRIETQQTSFAAPAGGELAVEASIEQPNVTNSNGLGYWPAFWMLGSAFRGNYLNWPGIGEVDIMEDINGLSSEFGTLHCGTSPGGPCNETTGIGSGQRACSGCQTSFHTYRVEIDRSVSPEQIRWYLDGNNFFTVNANQVDATTWANAVDHSFFIIFDLAMGGGFPAAFGGGPTSATISGGSMLVDYVHVFTASGSAPTPTPTASGSTPTPTPTASGSGFTQGVNSLSSSSALFWFQPSGWTAGYVILHYTVTGQTQQNVNMTYNSSTARWEYTVSGLSPGQTVTYSFTYQKSGLQYDTGTYTWTNSGATPTPTPTPNTCTGTFAEGVNNVSGSQAQFWFQPCSWTAGYVIVHYIVPGQVQQNVTMTYNSSDGRWEYTAGGMSSGQTITYWFTYQQSGVQHDTSTYTWTHP